MQFKISELHRDAELQQTFRWYAEFTGPPFSEVDKLRLRLTSVDFSSIQHTKSDVTVLGYNLSMPGLIQYGGEVTLNFYESVDVKIFKVFRRWYNDIHRIEGDTISGFTDVNGGLDTNLNDLYGNVKITTKNAEETEDTAIFNFQHCLVTQLDFGGTFEDGSSPNYFKPKITLEYAYM